MYRFSSTICSPMYCSHCLSRYYHYSLRVGWLLLLLLYCDVHTRAVKSKYIWIRNGLKMKNNASSSRVHYCHHSYSSSSCKVLQFNSNSCVVVLVGFGSCLLSLVVSYIHKIVFLRRRLVRSPFECRRRSSSSHYTTIYKKQR